MTLNLYREQQLHFNLSFIYLYTKPQIMHTVRLTKPEEVWCKNTSFTSLHSVFAVFRLYCNKQVGGSISDVHRIFKSPWSIWGKVILLLAAANPGDVFGQRGALTSCSQSAALAGYYQPGRELKEAAALPKSTCSCDSVIVFILTSDVMRLLMYDTVHSAQDLHSHSQV